MVWSSNINNTNNGVGQQVKRLIIAGFAKSKADASKLAGGLLNVYAAAQVVPSMLNITEAVNDAVSRAAQKPTDTPVAKPKSPAGKQRHLVPSQHPNPPQQSHQL